jgi:uncharacterized protein involved in type VI secretion and phage assembly
MNAADLLATDYAGHATHGRMYGAVLGVVTNLADPDNLGRVKVRYPWLSDDSESPWARVLTFMAGKSRGAVFRPGVGDEVVVICEHGDMRFPYVIGSVWNGVDGPPPHGSDQDNHVRLIRSATGHEILLDDTPGQERVVVSDQSGNRIELSSDGVVVKSTAIKIGGAGVSEGLVLGDALMTLFNAHTHPTGVGPSGPPTMPMVKGQHVSVKHKTE